MAEQVLLWLEALLRWILRVGLVIWVFLLLSEVGSLRVDVERLWTIGLAGGAALLGLKEVSGAIQRGEALRLRRSALRALESDPLLQRGPSKRVLTRYLLRLDRDKLTLFSWHRRLEVLLRGTLESILRAGSPRDACRAAGHLYLSILSLCRDFGSNPPSGPEASKEGGLASDLRRLEVALACVIMLTALYRFGIIRWGRGSWPLSRRRLSRLRRQWIPFCLIEPSERHVPAPTRDEFECTRMANGWSEDMEGWLVDGSREALLRLFTGIHRATPPDSARDCGS